MTERTALYRLYDAEDRLLYVGITGDPDYRWSQHATNKPWWPRVERKTLEWFEARADAATAEVAAIGSEIPLHNGLHVPSPITTTAEIRRHRDSSPYLQLAASLRSAIKSGEFPAGTKLPTLRDLQVRFDTTNATVQRALRQLKDEGLVEGRVGSGVYVLEANRGNLTVPLYDIELTAEMLRRALTEAELSTLATLLTE